MVALVCLGNFLRVALLLLGEPHAINYTEGISLHSAQQLLKGRSLYPPIQQEPYSYLAYPPGYPLLCAVVVGLFGNSLTALRCLTLAAEAVILWLFYLLLRRQGIGPRAGLFMGAWLAGWLSIQKFHTLARVDMFLQAAVLGFCLASLHLSKARNTWFWAATLLVPMALLFKASAGFDLIWCGLFYLLFDRRPAVFKALGLGAALALVLGFALNLSTSGEFWRHLVVYQGLSGVYPQWRDLGPFRIWVRFYLPLLVPSFLVLCSLKRMSLGPWMCLGSLLAFFLGSAKNGGDLNYALPVIIWSGATLARAYGCEQHFRWPARIGSAREFVPVVLLLSMVALPVYQDLRWPTRDLPPWHAAAAANLRPEPTAYRARLVNFMAEAEGPVLSEEPYFAVVNDKEVWMSDPFQLFLLWRAGRFDVTPVVQACASGRISHVVAGPRLLSFVPLNQVLRQHFEKVEEGIAIDRSTPLTIYRYRGKP